MQTIDQMQHKEEIIDLHQLLECQCHEFVEFSIGAKKTMYLSKLSRFLNYRLPMNYHDQIHSLQTMMLVMAVHQWKEYDDSFLNQILVNICIHVLQ